MSNLYSSIDSVQHLRTVHLYHQEKHLEWVYLLPSPAEEHQSFVSNLLWGFPYQAIYQVMTALLSSVSEDP